LACLVVITLRLVMPPSNIAHLAVSVPAEDIGA
jgi:hypothetical protein